jgi:hypothetical protein
LSILALTTATAQVLEMRRPFERFETGKILVGGEILGPVTSQLDPDGTHTNITYKAIGIPSGYLSADLWQFRLGTRWNGFREFAPFIYWNPVIGDGFGGDGSRWAGTIGWEYMDVKTDKFDPLSSFQADNSFNTPGNSINVMISYWLGGGLDTTDRRQLLHQAYPNIPEDQLDQWLAGRSQFELNYSGRGFIDTTDFNTPPLDTNSYVRGVKPKNLIPVSVPVHYSSRNGLSIGVGAGTGKYAGTGPVSKFFNITYSDDSVNKYTRLLENGVSPMMVLRYRYDDYIGELDLAGEDVNLGLIYRGMRDFDFEIGMKYLEHIVYRQSRGPNRPEFFIGVRYSPPFKPSYTQQEIGDEIFAPELDSDEDGIPDDIERNETLTDPNLADTDNDGLTDGLEVFSYKTNPLVADTDMDALSDGQEVLGDRKTDPLRWDTDEDGISDGEEVSRGTDPLLPATGERGR